MPRSIILIAAAALMVAAWFGVWSLLVAPDVSRVQASVDYHYQAMKSANRTVTFKAESVESAGFPFAFRVRVIRPTLSQIDGDTTYAISFDQIELQRVNKEEGRYRVRAPATFEALYAENGKAPENYTIVVNEMPAILLRALGSSGECPTIPGLKKCDAVRADAPLKSFAVQLPSYLQLDASLNGKTKQIGFKLMPVNVPLFAEIPADGSRPLQLFVGMLREALVFKE